MPIPPMYLANSMPMPRDDRGGRRLSDRLGGFAEGAALPGAAGLPAKPLPAALDQPLSAGGGSGGGERGGRRNGGGRNGGAGGAGGPPPPPPADAKEDPRAASGRRVSYHDMDLVAEVCYFFPPFCLELCLLGFQGDVELSY